MIPIHSMSDMHFNYWVLVKNNDYSDFPKYVKKLFMDSGFKILNVEGDKKSWKFIIVAQKK